MDNIFWGLFIIAFSYPVVIDFLYFEILPGFIGYIILAINFKKPSVQSSVFKKAFPFTIISIIISAIFFVIGRSGFLGYFLWLENMLSLIYLCFSYITVLGICNIEAKRDADLKGKYLKISCILMSLSQIIVIFTFDFLINNSLIILSSINFLGFIFYIVFFVFLNIAKNKYGRLPR